MKSRASRPKKPAAFQAPLPWFRLWTEFATDPKVQMLSEVLQRRFVMILCFTGARLVPTTDDASVAFAMRISGDEAVETKRALVAAGLISDHWFPVAWGRRQFKSDHDSAARKQRQRQRQRQRRDEFGQRDGDETVTAMSRDSHWREGEGEQRENRTDSEQSQSRSAAAVDNSRHGATTSGPTERFADNALPPKSQNPRSGRRNGAFEGINDAVEKLIIGGGCNPADIAGLAKIAGISEPQAATALRQLRDRGRLQ